jgi:hypothetical protein
MRTKLSGLYSLDWDSWTGFPDRGQAGFDLSSCGLRFCAVLDFASDFFSESFLFVFVLFMFGTSTLFLPPAACG